MSVDRAPLLWSSGKSNVYPRAIEFHNQSINVPYPWQSIIAATAVPTQRLCWVVFHCIFSSQGRNLESVHGASNKSPTLQERHDETFRDEWNIASTCTWNTGVNVYSCRDSNPSYTTQSRVHIPLGYPAKPFVQIYFKHWKHHTDLLFFCYFTFLPPTT